MSSNMKQSHHETPREEQQSTNTPPDEDDGASPSMTNVHQETLNTHSSSTSPTNQWEKFASKSKEEREKRANALQKRVGVTYKEYILAGEKYHLEYSRIDPKEVRNAADRELLRNKCAQLEVYSYSYNLAFYMLRLFERTMSELEKVESGEETDETGSDDMPTRPVLVEQRCKKLYAELYRQSD
ncbi:hypothetical protein BASA81_008630 [Batrachochytrium salamandrivorans]|nr:hypothetical protein BASA81_008630 [Batrachochytrium salamandrivorans]